MGLLKKINKPLRKMGFNLSRFSAGNHPLARRQQLLNEFEINLLLDVGANYGSYCQEMRSLGYKGKMISFEPLNQAFRQLQQNAKNDPDWEVMQLALGSEQGTTEINVAGNSYSSSLLPMHQNHLKSAPQSAYVGKESIEVARLDDLFHDLAQDKDNIYLKIDTQGFEMQVLQGALSALENINTIQLEMSLIKLYEGASSFEELYKFLTQRGYVLVSLESGFTDQLTGKMLQVDGIFHRDRNLSVK